MCQVRRRTNSVSTDLEKILKDKGIKTVIVNGTACERRRALYGERRGVARHAKSIVPVDGMSSVTIFTPSKLTALAAWPTAPAASAQKVTMTRSDMIKFLSGSDSPSPAPAKSSPA